MNKITSLPGGAQGWRASKKVRKMMGGRRKPEMTDKPMFHMCVLPLEGDFQALFPKVINRIPMCQEEKQQTYKAIGPQVRDTFCSPLCSESSVQRRYKVAGGPQTFED